MLQNTRWSDIFKHLERCGYDVYPPATKEGECLADYIVVKDNGMSKSPTVSSSIALYDILLYVPKNQYSTIENKVTTLKEHMDGLWPMIRPTHFVTAPFYDDAVKGWMISIQYQNYRKNNRP